MCTVLCIWNLYTLSVIFRGVFTLVPSFFLCFVLKQFVCLFWIFFHNTIKSRPFVFSHTANVLSSPECWLHSTLAMCHDIKRRTTDREKEMSYILDWQSHFVHPAWHFVVSIARADKVFSRAWCHSKYKKFDSRLQVKLNHKHHYSHDFGCDYIYMKSTLGLSNNLNSDFSLFPSLQLRNLYNWSVCFPNAKSR